MRILTSILLLPLVLLAGPASAEIAEELSQSALEHSEPLRLVDGALEGPGADWLLSRASDARFTLLGESHGNAETPILTEALLEALRPHGYQAYVVEAGPINTEQLVARLQSGGVSAATDMLRAYPFTLAFLDRHEELAAVDHALELGYEVWGIDQEFMGSARLLLHRLGELAEDQASRELAASMATRAQEGFQRFATTGDRSGAFLLTTTEEDYDRLADSFADEGEEAQRVVDQLRASSRIYGHYAAQRFFRNNADRIALMKNNLLDQIERSWGSPLGEQKALIKMGSAHAGRGRSPFHQHDVGNLAQELAAISRSESFHVTVLAASSIDAEGKVRRWDEPHLAPFVEHVGDDGPRVFDLGALRPLLTQARSLPEDLAETLEMALRYDALVAFPRFHPSEMVVDLSGR